MPIKHSPVTRPGFGDHCCCNIHAGNGELCAKCPRHGPGITNQFLAEKLTANLLRLANDYIRCSHDPCDADLGPDNHCILLKGHRPVKAPSGPHAPARSIPVVKPAVTLGLHLLAAQIHDSLNK